MRCWSTASPCSPMASRPISTARPSWPSCASASQNRGRRMKSSAGRSPTHCGRTCASITGAGIDSATLDLKFLGDKTMKLKLCLAAVAFAFANAAAAQEAVKIGVVQPLTGPVAYDGNIYVSTIRMLVDDLNAKGGVLRKKI